MSAPLLSLVIPNHDYGRFLPRLAADLAAQTLGLDAVEILLADDGSTDDSRRAAESLAALPCRSFAAYWLDHCGRPGLVRNQGLERASGRFLLCLDPDDRIAPGYLQACLAALDADPGASLAYTDFILDEPGGPRAVRLPEFDPALLRNQNILAPTAVLRRALWEDTGGYRADTAYEDWELWVRAASLGHRGVRVAGPLYTHVVHGANFSFAARRDDARSKAAIVLRNPGFFPAGVRHWAAGVMDGAPWAHPFPRGIIPLLADVETLLAIRDHVENPGP
ncbi:MAG: glycosyltransferase family A protein [Pseudodesulfovibrio sp.]